MASDLIPIRTSPGHDCLMCRRDRPRPKCGVEITTDLRAIPVGHPSAAPAHQAPAEPTSAPWRSPSARTARGSSRRGALPRSAPACRSLRGCGRRWMARRRRQNDEAPGPRGTRRQGGHMRPVEIRDLVGRHHVPWTVDRIHDRLLCHPVRMGHVLDDVAKILGVMPVRRRVSADWILGSPSGEFSALDVDGIYVIRIPVPIVADDIAIIASRTQAKGLVLLLSAEVWGRPSCAVPVRGLWIPGRG